MEVFLNKMDTILEKFYQTQSNISVINDDINKIKKEIEKNNIDNQEILFKIKDLNHNLDLLKAKSSNSESFWGGIIDFIVKVFYVIIVSYILYNLGWEGPPV